MTRWLPLAAVIAACVVVITIEVRSTFTLPWWTNTEEFPYAQEVVRFLSGDFHQRFFDIPGTPLMFLSSALFALPHWLMGSASHQSGYEHFSRQMTVLFSIMRAVEILAYLAAAWLVYLIARRFASRIGATAASVFVIASPVQDGVQTWMNPDFM